MIHTVKGFDIVNKAEIDVFLELACFFDDPVDVSNLICGSSAFSKTAWTSGRLLSHKKEQNNAICSNMDGPSDYHIKWSKSKANIIWYCLNVESEKKKGVQMNLPTHQK